MAETILIDAMPGEVRAAVLEDGRAVELLVEREGRRSLVGNVYLGRVARVLPGMAAAFVDIGLDRAGFLGLDDAGPDDRPCEGQAVRVQVARDAAGGKGVRLTRRVALAGHLLVYGPPGGRVSVSRRIEDGAERDRLARAVGAAAEPGEGFVARTAARGAGAAALAAEAASLRAAWGGIEARQAHAAAPALLHEEPGAPIRLIRDRAGAATERIVVDSPSAFAEARAWCAAAAPGLADRLALHAGPGPVFAEADVEAEIERALAPRVGLPSGGEIVVEATEALTAVDVNSGRFTGARASGEAAYATNLEAAVEIARQLRLRDLGGLIVVDFIHMDDGARWRSVLEALSRALAGDRRTSRLHGRTEAGLVEITRRRLRRPLSGAMTERCAGCGGSGRAATAETVALEAVRALGREACAAGPGALAIAGADEVIEALETGAAGALRGLEAALGRRVRLDRAPAFPRDRFEVSVGGRQG